jgi:hypothetical protein
MIPGLQKPDGYKDQKWEHEQLDEGKRFAEKHRGRRAAQSEIEASRKYRDNFDKISWKD